MDDIDTKDILSKLIKKKVRKVAGIYFLFKNEEIVYVGQSQSVGSRVYTHLSDKSKDFDYCAVLECGSFTKSAMDCLEARFIAELNPRYNNSIPSNRRYKTLPEIRNILRKKSVKSINLWDLKRWARENNITPIGMDYYKVSDFEGLK